MCLNDQKPKTNKQNKTNGHVRRVNDCCIIIRHCKGIETKCLKKWVNFWNLNKCFVLKSGANRSKPATWVAIQELQYRIQVSFP